VEAVDARVVVAATGLAGSGVWLTPFHLTRYFFRTFDEAVIPVVELQLLQR
jgi:hypothetical protein